MLNKIYLTGNLGGPPKLYKTKDGRELAILSVATSFPWKNEEGAWESQTDWHRIVVFRESLILWIKEKLQKGDQLLIEGRLSYSETTGRKTACIVISGKEGSLHFLRSSSKQNLEEGSQTDVSSSTLKPPHPSFLQGEPANDHSF